MVKIVPMKGTARIKMRKIRGGVICDKCAQPSEKVYETSNGKLLCGTCYWDHLEIKIPEDEVVSASSKGQNWAKYCPWCGKPLE